MANLPEVARVVDQPKSELVTGPRDAALASAGAPVAPAANAPPKTTVTPFPNALNLKFTLDDKLAKGIAGLSKLTGFKGASIMVAIANKDDYGTLTFSDKEPIAYAGHNYNEIRFGASVAKVAIMVAAFALRAAVQKAAATLSAKSADELFTQLESSWRAIIRTKFPKRAADFPDLRTIFAATPASNGRMSVEFRKTGESLGALEDIHHALEHANEPPKVNAAQKAEALKNYAALGFFEYLTLMIRWSDNKSAGTCMRRLGFQYINGTMLSLGLVYPQGAKGDFNHGLWIDSNYGAESWKPRLHTGKDVVAFALTKMMVGLATGTLIDADASKRMKDLMDRKTLFGHMGYIQASLPVVSRDELYCKLGRIDHTLSDVALVHRLLASPAKQHGVWYVVVMLGVPGGYTKVVGDYYKKYFKPLTVGIDNAVTKRIAAP